jgi:hypothetical protein
LESIRDFYHKKPLASQGREARAGAYLTTSRDS